MKRAWSSYHIKKYFKELNPKKIHSNSAKKDISRDDTTSVFIQNGELKHLNYKFFKDLKNQNKSNFTLKPKSFLRKKDYFHHFFFKNMPDETTALLDAIKVQHGLNKFSNIAGSTRGSEKRNKMISSGTFVDLSNRTKKNIEKRSRVQSSIHINKKKRNFPSKFSFNKIGMEFEESSSFANSVVNSYLMKFNSKNYYFRNIENDKNSELSKTLTPNTIKVPSYNINIGTIIKNRQNIKETEKEKDLIDQDLYKFIQERKNIKSYEKDNPEIIKIKTEFLIKFAKISDLYKKLKLAIVCFRPNLKELYELSIKSLIKNFDTFNNYLLNDIQINENILELWTNVLNYINNVCFQTSRIQKFLFDELNFLKIENLLLKQKLQNQETELNTKTKEINEINKLIIKYDLNSKINIGKQVYMSINNIKNKFTNQESQYVMTIHKLNQEIQNLTESLNKNKPDLQLIEKLKEQLKLLEKKYEDEVDKLRTLNGQKSINIQTLNQRVSNLYEEINELENEIINLKNKEQAEQEKNIMLNAKIENLNIVNEKNQKIIKELRNNINNYKENNTKENEKHKAAKIILISPK